MLVVIALMGAGCGRMLSMDYEPTNPWKGEGALAVSIFRYDPAEDHRVRPREVETNQAAKTDLFLSQDIGAFFAEALRRELVHSGYTVKDSSPLSIWGSVTRFYVDWRRSETERVFELQATYNVQSGEKTLFTWTCSSIQEGPNLFAQDGILIRKGAADCMKRFIEASQEAHVF
ncbi:MAG TPA: hypothetical protein VJ746_05305 [Nitrospira sp.]|nr:hypothetical protein [Nitrospira sp.]